MSFTQQGVGDSVRRWVLLTGDRAGIAFGVSAVIVVLSGALAATGVVYVRSGSTLSTALSSGLLSGLVTLLTVTLSINQLILSRVFGSPSSLSTTVEKNMKFRERIEQLAGVPVSPNDPDEFLALIGETLAVKADQLPPEIEADRELNDTYDQFVDELATYGEHLGTAGETEDEASVLVITLGTEYADKLTETRRLQFATDSLSENGSTTLADVLELLKAVATMRQFLKTIVIQQDLAQLSRQLIYTGLISILTTYYLSTVYTASSSTLGTTLPGPLMPIVTSVATGIIFLPLALLISYLLRVATVTSQTVSVGSFIPPN